MNQMWRWYLVERDDLSKHGSHNGSSREEMTEQFTFVVPEDFAGDSTSGLVLMYGTEMKPLVTGLYLPPDPPTAFGTWQGADLVPVRRKRKG